MREALNKLQLLLPVVAVIHFMLWFVILMIPRLGEDNKKRGAKAKGCESPFDREAGISSVFVFGMASPSQQYSNYSITCFIITVTD